MADETPRRPGRTFLALGIIVTLGAAACSNGSGVGSEQRSDPAAAAADALDSGNATNATEVADTNSTPPATTVPTVIQGMVINQYLLGLGECFNQIEDLQQGVQVVVTTRVGCFMPHQSQVFYMLEFPAGSPAIYPGDKVMRDFALQSCYREFESWVGTKYETSELEIDVLTPNQTNFEDSVARYRGIHCFVRRGDGDNLNTTTRGLKI